ncbi:unnamed protein product [Amoebophrya sp. A25]|nr:unnamed protein product [Amoebophrya sp. A25]|eukprot:GSA25T00021736001.1
MVDEKYTGRLPSSPEQRHENGVYSENGKDTSDLAPLAVRIPPPEVMSFGGSLKRMLDLEGTTGAHALRGLLEREGESNLCFIDLEQSCRDHDDDCGATMVEHLAHLDDEQDIGLLCGSKIQQGDDLSPSARSTTQPFRVFEEGKGAYSTSPMMTMTGPAAGPLGVIPSSSLELGDLTSASSERKGLELTSGSVSKTSEGPGPGPGEEQVQGQQHQGGDTMRLAFPEVQVPRRLPSPSSAFPEVQVPRRLSSPSSSPEDADRRLAEHLADELLIRNRSTGSSAADIGTHGRCFTFGKEDVDYSVVEQGVVEGQAHQSGVAEEENVLNIRATTAPCLQDESCFVVPSVELAKENHVEVLTGREPGFALNRDDYDEFACADHDGGNPDPSTDRRNLDDYRLISDDSGERTPAFGANGPRIPDIATRSDIEGPNIPSLRTSCFSTQYNRPSSQYNGGPASTRGGQEIGLGFGGSQRTTEVSISPHHDNLRDSTSTREYGTLSPADHVMLGDPTSYPTHVYSHGSDDYRQQRAQLPKTVKRMMDLFNNECGSLFSRQLQQEYEDVLDGAARTGCDSSSSASKNLKNLNSPSGEHCSTPSTTPGSSTPPLEGSSPRHGTSIAQGFQPAPRIISLKQEDEEYEAHLQVQSILNENGHDPIQSGHPGSATPSGSQEPQKQATPSQQEGAIRVKHKRNRPTQAGDSFPRSSVFDCRKLHEKLSDKEWAAAKQDMAEQLQHALTRAPEWPLDKTNKEKSVNASSSEDGEVGTTTGETASSDVEHPEEPSIPFPLAMELAEGLCDLAKFIAETWLFTKGKVAEKMLHPESRDRQKLVWMSQCIVRSPDDEFCSDGPCWHIDEHFYYLHGVVTFLSVTTQLVDIRDEVGGCGRVVPKEKYWDEARWRRRKAELEKEEREKEEEERREQEEEEARERGETSPKEANEKTSTGSSNQPEAEVKKEALDLDLDKQELLQNDPVEEAADKDPIEPAFSDPDYYERFSPIRQFAIKEHTIGKPREMTEQRFEKYPDLHSSEVKRVLEPRTGRDFVMYFGGEAERPQSLRRAAIHQGPHKNDVFRRKGRVSFFFAIFDWA